MLRCGLLWYAGMDAVFLWLPVYGRTALNFQHLGSRPICVLHPACVSRLVLRFAIGSRAGRLALQLSLTSRLKAPLSGLRPCCLPVVVAAGRL